MNLEDFKAEHKILKKCLNQAYSTLSAIIFDTSNFSMGVMTIVTPILVS